MFITNVASSSFNILVAWPDEGMVSNLHCVNAFILIFGRILRWLGLNIGDNNALVVMRFVIIVMRRIGFDWELILSRMFIFGIFSCNTML